MTYYVNQRVALACHHLTLGTIIEITPDRVQVHWDESGFSYSYTRSEAWRILHSARIAVA